MPHASLSRVGMHLIFDPNSDNKVLYIQVQIELYCRLEGSQRETHPLSLSAANEKSCRDLPESF